MPVLEQLDLRDQVAERGGRRIGDVIVFSAAQPVYKDQSDSHRFYDENAKRQDFSIQDLTAGVTYHASHTVFVPGPGSPRHHHSFEQLRFVLGGEVEYGRKRYGAGWLGYFPEGVYYGPQSNPSSGQQIVAQFPGPSGMPFHSRDDTRRSREGVRALGGRFENGICIWPDGKKQDAHEALMEWLYGKDAVYPPARYDEQIWFNTEKFSWQPAAAAGVSVKHLGFFNERGPAMELIQLDPGAALPAGHSDRLVIRWIYEGSVEYAGIPCPATPGETASNIAYLPGASYDSVRSGGGARLLSLELKIPEGSLPYLV